MMNKNMTTVILVALLVGVVGFFGGIQYQKSKAPTSTSGQNGQFRNRFGQNGQNFCPVRGQVLNADATSLTVKMQDGSSRIVILSGTTLFMKSTTGSKDDVKTGDTVMVVGPQNADGSVTAQDVQINPPQLRQATPSETQQ